MTDSTKIGFDFSRLLSSLILSLSTEWVDYVEEPMKYQAFLPHFGSVGGWLEGSWGGWWWGGLWGGWMVVGWVMGWVGGLVVLLVPMTAPSWEASDTPCDTPMLFFDNLGKKLDQIVKR